MISRDVHWTHFNRQLNATEGSKGLAVFPSFKLPHISEDDPLFGVLKDSDVGLDFAMGMPKISKEILDGMRQYLSRCD